MAQTLTEVAVQVHADLKQLKPEAGAGSKVAGEAAGEAMGDGITKGADGKLRNAQGKFVAQGKKTGKSFAGGVESGFGDAFTKVLATMAAKFALAGGAAAAAAPGVLQFVGALAPAAGALVVLPAALLSLKAASLTTKLAVAGVGDAISAGFGDDAKKADAALKGLSKNAQTFAKQIIAAKGPVDALRETVSDRFFQPMIDDLKPLIGTLLPQLRTDMGDLAGTIGASVRRCSRPRRRRS